jgi:tetratricopeptide (TPR) repeat protein
MPSYQKALELAVEKKFSESLDQLEKTITEVENIIGKHTNYHLFIYQRMASIHMMLRDLESVENTFQKCIEVAEKATSQMSRQHNQTQSIFIWQNNLLKFYIQHDIKRAIDYSHELIDEVGNILN